MRMAGYSKISATAFMTKQVTIDKNKAKGKPILETVPNTDRKIYIPTYINRFRMVGCVDSGSDLTILHDSYYKRIYKNSAKLLKSDITHITTFCDTALPIKGKFSGLFFVWLKITQELEFQYTLSKIFQMSQHFY